MKLLRPVCVCAVLLLLAGTAGAQTPGRQDGEQWISYRDAYRAMIWFDKYGKPKNFLQMHYQLVPKDGGTTLEGVRLTLYGKTSQLNLPLDATGRAMFPLLKAAYDENAELVVNRKPGQFRFAPRVSIVHRPDGSYEAADLRAACEQALAFQRYVDVGALRARQCVGVRFSFSKTGAEPNVRFRKSERESLALPAGEGAPFPDQLGESVRIATYRFADWPEKGQLTSPNPPLAIAPLFE